MFSSLTKCVRRLWPMVTLAVLIFGAVYGRAQMVDLNANGMSDIWELVFGAGGLDPNGDPDQDGAPNLVEAIAGTDPFDSNSVPRITFAVSSSTNLTLKDRKSTRLNSSH